MRVDSSLHIEKGLLHRQADYHLQGQEKVTVQPPQPNCACLIIEEWIHGAGCEHSTGDILHVFLRHEQALRLRDALLEHFPLGAASAEAEKESHGA